MEYGVKMGKDKKEAVLNRAEELILKEGIQALTIRKICAATGLALSTFYFFFKSKQALVDEVYLRAQTRMIDGCYFEHPEKTPYESLLLNSKRYIKNALTYPKDFIFVRQFRNSPSVSGSLFYDEDYALGSKRLSELITDGVFADLSIIEVNAMLTGSLDELIFSHLQGRIKITEKSAENFIAQLWKAVVKAEK